MKRMAALSAPALSSASKVSHFSASCLFFMMMHYYYYLFLVLVSFFPMHFAKPITILLHTDSKKIASMMWLTHVKRILIHQIMPLKEVIHQINPTLVKKKS